MTSTTRIAARAAVALTLIGGAVFGGAGAAQADTGHFDVYSSVTGGHGYGSSVTWDSASGHIELNGGAIKDNSCDNKGSVLQVAAGTRLYYFYNTTGCNTIFRIPNGTTIGYTTYSYIRLRACLYQQSNDTLLNCGSWLRVDR